MAEPSEEQAMTPTDTVCAYCDYWDGAEEENGTPFGETVGECRRKPPHVFLIADEAGELTAVTHWPQTAATEWCGEFRLRPDRGEPAPDDALPV